MAKLKKSEFTKARDWIDALPKERRDKVVANAADIVRGVHLAELRKAMDTTQTEVSTRSGMKQAEISRIERNPASVQLKTMERYIKSLGGALKIVAEFPDGTTAHIPIEGGKPVKSRLAVKTSGEAEN